jgi:hypothetical protein
MAFLWNLNVYASGVWGEMGWWIIGSLCANGVFWVFNGYFFPRVLIALDVFLGVLFWLVGFLIQRGIVMLASGR